MPRCKKEKLETIDELIEEVQAAEKNVVEELNQQPQLNVDNTSDKKRDELLKLAEDGELDKSVAYIKNRHAMRACVYRC